MTHHSYIPLRECSLVKFVSSPPSHSCGVPRIIFPFYLSWVAKTWPNQWTKWMESTWFSTWDPRNRPAADLVLRLALLVGKTVHNVGLGRLECILGLTNLHNQSSQLPRNIAPRKWCPPTWKGTKPSYCPPSPNSARQDCEWDALRQRVDGAMHAHVFSCAYVCVCICV